MSFFEFLSNRSDKLLGEAAEHAVLTLEAVVISTIIGVVIGVLSYRRPRLASLSTATTGVFLTIPSFALLGLLVAPLGLGTTPVLLCLVLYGLLPVVRNTIVGLQGVNPALVEAGKGMGLSRVQLMTKVELPLAWPVILTGIRVSTQILLGVAAIGAYLNGPGLGNSIFEGLSRFGAVNSVNQAVAGTLGVILLALLFDLVYVAVGRATTSKGIRV